MNNRFKHFFIKQKSDTVVLIQCLFETITDSVEEEAESILNVIFLTTRFDVVIALENPVYLTPKFIMQILNFARELKLSGRKTTLLNPPESLTRYLARFDIDHILELSNN